MPIHNQNDENGINSQANRFDTPPQHPKTKIHLVSKKQPFACRDSFHE
jgi:hypothetical protein